MIYLYCYDNNSAVLHITIEKIIFSIWRRPESYVVFSFTHWLFLYYVKVCNLNYKTFIQDMICSQLKWFQYNQKTFYMINMWNFQVIKMLKCIIYFLLHHGAFTIFSFQLQVLCKLRLKNTIYLELIPLSNHYHCSNSQPSGVLKVYPTYLV